MQDVFPLPEDENVRGPRERRDLRPLPILGDAEIPLPPEDEEALPFNQNSPPNQNGISRESLNALRNEERLRAR